jgi:ABC-2 type transport system ATP-binding protein
VVTRGLGKRYGRRDALVGLDLEVPRGEVFGYLGPNGAGKSTTLRLLMGFLRPTSGSARVLGGDAWHDAVQVHRRVGYVPGDPALYGRRTGLETLTLLARLRGGDDLRRACALADDLQLDLGRRVGELSKGNRQKVALVAALAPQPELLLLDEPTTALDPLVQQQVHGLFRAHADAGGTVLLSSHVLDEVDRTADRVGILRAGRLVAVEQLADLRARSLHAVVARTATPPDAAAWAALPGVRDLEVDDAGVSCRVPRTGLDDVVTLLGRTGLLDLRVEPASLEETFLGYYEEAPA